MMDEFKLNAELNGNALVISTNGYINNHGGEQILKCYEENADKDMKFIILDLENSKVVNSIGISFIIELIEKLNAKGIKLIFTNLIPAVEKTFTIMGLFQFSEMAENLDKAIEIAN